MGWTRASEYGENIPYSLTAKEIAAKEKFQAEINSPEWKEEQAKRAAELAAVKLVTDFTCDCGEPHSFRDVFNEYAPEGKELPSDPVKWLESLKYQKPRCNLCCGFLKLVTK